MVFTYLFFYTFHLWPYFFQETYTHPETKHFHKLTTFLSNKTFVQIKGFLDFRVKIPTSTYITFQRRLNLTLKANISFSWFCLIPNLIFSHFFLFVKKKWRKKGRKRERKKGRMVGKRKEGKKSEWRKVRPEITLGWGKWYSPFIVPVFYNEDTSLKQWCILQGFPGEPWILFGEIHEYVH